ncbi:MAG: hypothetical protein CME70_18380 [Halobacteriovorax sp.]|nr:hypothetical protein [Halobacteriovorax sp.]
MPIVLGVHPGVASKHVRHLAKKVSVFHADSAGIQKTRLATRFINLGWNDRLKIEELKDLERVLTSREVMLDNMARIQEEMQAELQRINLWKETTYNCTPMGGYPNTAIMREWVLDLIDCMMAANEIRNQER